MIEKLKKYREIFWVKNILLPFLLILPVIFFAIPTFSLGIDNINMIGHFDKDEAYIIDFAGRTYVQGLTPLNYFATYPQLFYYLAGIFLFPYTLLNGINHQTIALTLRSFNVLISILLVIFLYFFNIKFFKSKLIAFFTCLFLATTPEILWWSINSRPHLLSIIFTVIAFYYCFKLAEQYNAKFLVWAVMFSIFSFSTNFFGVFIIPSICLVYFYHMLKLHPSHLISYLRSKRKLIYFINSMLIVCSIFIPLLAIMAFFKFRNYFNYIGIGTFHKFLHYRNFRLIFLCAITLMIFSLFWLAINIFTGILARREKLWGKYVTILFINKGFLFLFYLLCTFCFVFLVLNPPYLLYPVKNAKAMIFQFSMTTGTSSQNIGLNKPIFDPSGINWVKMLFNNTILNKWFGILFLVYFFYEILNFRKNYLSSKSFLLQRGLLWLYCLFLLVTLIVCVAHQPYHYLLTIGLIMEILISFGFVEAIKHKMNKLAKLFFIILFGSILIIGLYERIGKIASIYEAKISKKNDTGLLIGNWLESNYGHNTRIWIDDESFYIPPKFGNIYVIPIGNEIGKYIPEINKTNPDLLIVTSCCDESLTNAKLINQSIESFKLSGFKLIKTFKYTGALSLEKSREFGKYSTINIYSKKN